MKELLVAVVYLSIGVGVTVAYSERHHKTDSDMKQFVMLGSVVWPGLIAADLYRSVFPKQAEGGAA